MLLISIIGPQADLQIVLYCIVNLAATVTAKKARIINTDICK